MKALFAVACIVAASIVVGPASADFLEWIIPGANVLIPIEGKFLKGNRTRNRVSIDHPKYGKMIFSTQFVNRVLMTDDLKSKVLGQVRTAYKNQNPDEMFRVSLVLLKHAWIKEYYDTIDRILELKPDHVGAMRVDRVRKQMLEEVADGGGEKKMRDVVHRNHMTVASSRHFIVLHDLGTEKRDSDRGTVIEERLKLLENVYESFVLFFYARGGDLEVPKEKMRVVFFKEKKDYKEFATSLSPSLKSAAGFWDPDSNISFFFSYSTDETFVQLSAVAKSFKDQEKAMVRAKQGEIVIFSRTLNVLVQLWQEELDIGLITHEATHQLAGSTGLLPRSVRVPFWIHEGLAMHFESPKGASWAGIGAINKERLEWYRGLADNQKLASLDFIIGDELFNYARAANELPLLHDAYGQGWALTHFLLDQHFDETVKYYKLLGSMPRELVLTPKTLKLLFDRCFTKIPRKELQSEFRHYMTRQKTDYEKAIAGAKVDT